MKRLSAAAHPPPLPQAQERLETALGLTTSNGEASSIKNAIERLNANEEQEEDEL